METPCSLSLRWSPVNPSGRTPLELAAAATRMSGAKFPPRPKSHRRSDLLQANAMALYRLLVLGPDQFRRQFVDSCSDRGLAPTEQAKFRDVRPAVHREADSPYEGAVPVT